MWVLVVRRRKVVSGDLKCRDTVNGGIQEIRVAIGSEAPREVSISGCSCRRQLPEVVSNLARIHPSLPGTCWSGCFGRLARWTRLGSFAVN